MMNPAEIAHGPFLIGVAINILLYGIMVTQVYLYFTTYKSLHSCVLQTLSTLFLILSIFTKPLCCILCLQPFYFTVPIDPILTGIIGGSVQLFFAWRIYVLSKNLFVVAIVVLLSLAGILGSIGTTIAVTIIPQFIKFQKFEVIVIIWLAGSACADVIIASALVLYLRNRRDAFPGTNDVIDRVIRLTMQTGLITSMCAVIDLITYLTLSSGMQTTQQGTVQLQPGMRPEVFVHIEEHELVDGVKSRDLFDRPEVRSEASSHQSKDGPV
ncbi:hypothetical protein V8B97DRAFT_1916527 [Scleroderma yunnanense]